MFPLHYTGMTYNSHFVITEDCVEGTIYQESQEKPFIHLFNLK